MSENYRWFLGFPIAFGLLRTILWLLCFKIESPQYFIDKKGSEESFDDVDINLGLVFCDEEKEIVHRYLTMEHEKKKNQKAVTFTTLFTPEYRKRFFAGLAVNVIQQLSGVNFFIFYSTSIFNTISGNGDMVNLLIGISNFCSSFIGMWFLGLFGRKTNLVYGLLAQGVMFWAMGMMFYFSWWGLLYPAAILFI